MQQVKLNATQHRALIDLRPIMRTPRSAVSNAHQPSEACSLLGIR
jgi:hypothetical protein